MEASLFYQNGPMIAKWSNLVTYWETYNNEFFSFDDALKVVQQLSILKNSKMLYRALNLINLIFPCDEKFIVIAFSECFS